MDQPDMSFREAIELFRQVYRRFAVIEERPWGVEGAMIEMTKQVGELAKQIMLTEHYYFPDRANTPGYETSKDVLADELADVFSMLIRIADYYEIDLLQAHIEARKAEQASLDRLGA